MDNKENIEDRIAAIHSELTTYRLEILKHVKALHSQNVSNFKVELKNDPRNAVKVLRQDVLDLLGSSQENSLIMAKS